ncbi:hypothetical protein [Gorillibacterium timonense]|uniref:hypothetical protein n=1 Tax=Gorillibacterium timonense TaxID=1689269 RepID=UPI00071C6841|nr:hypothetical protein [Gorillibacterium timonense]
MEKFDLELKKVIDRLEEHREKKMKLIETRNWDQDWYQNAQGRITALDHALSELNHLWLFGKAK